jgi:hypothetical protein
MNDICKYFHSNLARKIPYSMDSNPGHIVKIHTNFYNNFNSMKILENLGKINNFHFACTNGS